MVKLDNTITRLSRPLETYITAANAPLPIKKVCERESCDGIWSLTVLRFVSTIGVPRILRPLLGHRALGLAVGKVDCLVGAGSSLLCDRCRHGRGGECEDGKVELHCGDE